ncbi:hypothetical protein [Brumicola blandensis]|uniref:Uncharacterized protein n=1 Tax=Brumicola blandensis TaxID=3075611 RepID=A0AAW8R576_9ALTE|nr:hypothetical protein [Alteromonas sp. W409]MDT0583864.1 hypothetical protein [Alteromonas sp. W409]
MNKPKFSGVFGYLQAIVLSNVAGAITSFIVAFLVFWQKQSDAAEGMSSIADNALSVGSFLFFGGLTYSMIAISPVVFMLKKQKKTQQSLALALAIAPGLFMLGSGYWDILAFSYGISTALVFLSIYSLSNMPRN